jgi:hypothetical protein
MPVSESEANPIRKTRMNVALDGSKEPLTKVSGFRPLTSCAALFLATVTDFRTDPKWPKGYETRQVGEVLEEASKNKKPPGRPAAGAFIIRFA